MSIFNTIAVNINGETRLNKITMDSIIQNCPNQLVEINLEYFIYVLFIYEVA